MPVTPIPYYRVRVVQRHDGMEHGGELLFSFTSTPRGVAAVSLGYVWTEMRVRIVAMQDNMNKHTPMNLERIWYCIPPDVGDAGIDLEGGS